MRNTPSDSQIANAPPRATRFALVLSAINVRRVLPGLQSFVASGDNFWLVDIYRPFEELKQRILDWKPAGIITEWIPDRSQPIIDLGFPTVIFTSRRYSANASSVDVDHHEIGRMAADHFLSLGLRNFAFYGNITPYSEMRFAGFEAHLSKIKISPPSYIEDTGWQRQYIEHWHESDEDLINWVQALPKPVGILVAHDPMGRTLAEACTQNGIKIPETVAILGVNDDELICQLTNPPLSSIEIPWAQMGSTAHQILKDLISFNSSKIEQKYGVWHPEIRGADTKFMESDTMQKSEFMETDTMQKSGIWHSTKCDFQFPKPIILPPAALFQRASTNRLAIDDKRLVAALRIIREEACKGLSVKQLVEQLRCSRRRLEQQFKLLLNRSPRDEIIRVRFERATEILRLSDRTMPDIAEACGFSNAELFSVNFKKQMGISPSAYRKQFRSPR